MFSKVTLKQRLLKEFLRIIFSRRFLVFTSSFKKTESNCVTFSYRHFLVCFQCIDIILDIEIDRSRACLHGGGAPEVGEVSRLPEVTRLSIWSLILIWSRLHDRWGDPPRRVARSARPGNPLSRGQILPRKRSRWSNPPSRGPIRNRSISRKIHFGGGFARQDKTRQDNALFGVLYSPMYIDFIQII